MVAIPTKIATATSLRADVIGGVSKTQRGIKIKQQIGCL